MTSRWFHTPDWHMVWLTGLLFVVGIVTAWIFYRQFSEMKTQTGILNDQAKQAAADSIEAGKRVERQLDLAGKQVKAAQDSVNAIKQQMRQDQRAWMSVAVTGAPVPGAKQGTITFKIAENRPIEIPLQLMDIGKTSARSVEAVFFVEVVKNGQLPRLDSPRKMAESGFSSGILYPNIPYESSAFRGRPIDRAEQEDLIAGRAYIAVHGRVDFRDVFKVRHWTKFCLWVPLANAQYTSRECAQYNNVDNN